MSLIEARGLGFTWHGCWDLNLGPHKELSVTAISSVPKQGLIVNLKVVLVRLTAYQAPMMARAHSHLPSAEAICVRGMPDLLCECCIFRLRSCTASALSPWGLSPAPFNLTSCSQCSVYCLFCRSVSWRIPWSIYTHSLLMAVKHSKAQYIIIRLVFGRFCLFCF